MRIMPVGIRAEQGILRSSSRSISIRGTRDIRDIRDIQRKYQRGRRRRRRTSSLARGLWLLLGLVG